MTTPSNATHHGLALISARSKVSCFRTDTGIMRGRCCSRSTPSAAATAIATCLFRPSRHVPLTRYEAGERRNTVNGIEASHNTLFLPPPLMSLAFFKVEDQPAKLHVGRRKHSKFSRVEERSREIAGLPGDRHKGEKRVPIRRMAFVRSLEQLHRLSRGAGGIQRDRVDIGIARVVGRKLASLPQFRDCISVIVLTHECKAQG